MKLSLNIQKPLISFELDVSFTCENKRLLVVIGPSGAGKTMLILTHCRVGTSKNGKDCL
jgi:ABC-type molybdate transport system ATPase subunit